MPKRLVSLDLRRRNCARCTRWKHAVDFPWRWKAKGKELPIPYIHNVCLSCKAEAEKQRYNALSPSEKRARGVRANESARKRRDKLASRIVTLEERLVRYRQRVGIPKRKYDNEILLDLLPLRMFLLRQARMMPMVEIADAVGMDEAVVRRHVNGFYWESDCKPRPVRQVTLGIVDAYLTKLNAEERLEELYPEVDDLLEGYFSDSAD